jgi:Transposase
LAPAGGAVPVLPGLGKRPGFPARRPAGACHPSTTKGMTLTIVDEARPVTGGVDTHADAHVAAALNGIGGLLGVQEFAATPAGYARLLGWLQGFGTVGLVGIEGTGSYGAGLARHITAAGIRVVEVDRAWPLAAQGLPGGVQSRLPYRAAPAT